MIAVCGAAQKTKLTRNALQADFPLSTCRMSALISVRDLYIDLARGTNRVSAVRGISFDIQKGEIHALVGESGSGKTLTALSLLGLIDPPLRVSAGSILFREENLTSYNEEQWTGFRGNKAAMIFQEPMTALNPVFTVGFQIGEVLTRHMGLKGAERTNRIQELLERVGIADSAMRMKQYPFQLSGGLRQRVMIAMALASSPELLIADEPTTALDVTIQAQILSLLKELNVKSEMGILLITHDLGIVSMLAHRVSIMYAGKIVESGPVAAVLKKSLHPYTRGLLQSIPSLTPPGSPIPSISGSAPPLQDIPQGCAFAPRCPRASSVCSSVPPKVRSGKNHIAECFHPYE